MKKGALKNFVKIHREASMAEARIFIKKRGSCTGDFM